MDYINKIYWVSDFFIIKKKISKFLFDYYRNKIN